MARGFFSGIVWGSITSVGLAAAVSIGVGTEAPVGPRVDPAPAGAQSDTPKAETDLAADQDATLLVNAPQTQDVTEEDTENPDAGDATEQGVESDQETQSSAVPEAEEESAAAPLVAAAQPASEGTGALSSVEPTTAEPATQPPLPAQDVSEPVAELAPAAEAEDRFADVTESIGVGLGDPVKPLIAPEAPGEVLENVDAPPIEAFAAAFDDPAGRPLMAILLVDDGAPLPIGEVSASALADFPYPLSFAVDANLPDAAKRAAAFRAQGAEVLAMTDVTAAALPADVEVLLAGALDAVPEAIGVLEGAETGLQSSREISEQAAAKLGASGHGIVFRAKGLNTAQQLALRQGTPAVTVFRDFDSAGQNPTTIRRFLNQAAFRAARQDGVVMLGHLRSDTIKALLLWGLQDRASQVALVPVSAVLKAQLPAN